MESLDEQATRREVPEQVPKAKIVIVVDNFNADLGYLEYYLARELSRLGVLVYIFSFTAKRGITISRPNEGFVVVRLPYFRIVHGYHVPSISAARYAFKFVRDTSPDAVHCQPLFSPLALLFIAAKKNRGFKLVGSVMTGTLSTDSFRERVLYNLTKLAITQYIVKVASAIFALNDQVSEMLLNTFKVQSSKIEIIPLGVDPSIFRFDVNARAEIRESLGINGKDIVIIYTGKIAPSKDLHVLLNAIAPLVKVSPTIKVLMIGKAEPAYLSLLKQMAIENDIVDNVIFREAVHRLDLPKMLSVGDIAVWPGGPSISIFEAASVGLPVISGSRFFYSMIEQYQMGFVIERGNVEQLRSFLSILISDSQLRQTMARRAEDAIHRTFNWQTIAQRYLEIYLSGIERGGPGP